ncbi:glycosyltransferase family 4 protein [Mesobacillus selenatarsenatis]|uniref:Mannosyl transferase n=1 Tax=Mesobacillus selenatarsenatis (strain DSM 18680 / JCM 14380 / FERM P-15431 / SF-1) TaxID=1321606 RepID=A0A0A8X8T4_MESS1|nr:glycosyltransferase family 4 protein [Mesobacillus selenatarsenatis]GAM15407.1 mannosyl transferase [Mesobacillus selenatarsenatis SF-1]
MNLLFITDFLDTGGAERYFVKCENMIPDEKLQIYTAARKGSFVQYLANPANFTAIRGNPITNLIILFWLVVRKDISAIHANSLRMLFHAVLLKCFFPRIKLIYTKHNVTLLDHHFPSLLVFLLRYFVARIITVYQGQADELATMGIPAAKIKTIYNGVDLQQFQYVNNRQDRVKKTIGILGRLSPEKNIPFFLKIAEKLNGESYDFLIAGDGPDRDKIEDKIKQSGLEERVEMLGDISNPDDFLASIDVFVLTSFREAFPMSILEAFAVGTPVVTIDVGGISEAVHNEETGILIETHSEDEFSSKIAELLRDKDKVEHIRAAARKAAETKFNLQHMIHETKQVYLEVHEDRRM